MPKKRLALLIGFVFIDVLGYSLFFPLLPYYAEIFGAGPALVGLMIASNAAAQFIAAPVVGRLSDRFGRRPMLIVSIAGTLISFFLLGLAEPIGAGLADLLPGIRISRSVSTAGAAWTVAVLFFCRILDGLAGGNVSLARAYVADITDEQNRARVSGFDRGSLWFGVRHRAGNRGDAQQLGCGNSVIQHGRIIAFCDTSLCHGAGFVV